MDRYDLHVHTGAGKGEGTILDAANAAKSVGLAGICIVDDAMDPEACANAATETGIQVLCGQEIDAIEGMILGIGLHTPVREGISIVDAILAIERQNGVAIPSRPLRMLSGVGPSLLAKLPVQVVEGRNGRDRALVQENTMKLADAIGLATVGGSDNRSLDQIGVAYTMLEGNPLDALLAGKVGAGGNSFARRKKWAASLKRRLSK